MFTFPETLGTADGVTVKVGCPFGYRDSGLIPIINSVTEEMMQNYMARLKNESGAYRNCTIKTENEKHFAEWAANVEVRNCRTKVRTQISYRIIIIFYLFHHSCFR